MTVIGFQNSALYIAEFYLLYLFTDKNSIWAQLYVFSSFPVYSIWVIPYQLNSELF